MKLLARWHSLWPHTRALCVLVVALFALPSVARAAGCGPHRGAPPANGFEGLAALQRFPPATPNPAAPCTGPTCSGRRVPAVPLSPSTTELKVEQRWAQPVAFLTADVAAPALLLAADEPLPLGGHPSSVYHPPR